MIERELQGWLLCKEARASPVLDTARSRRFCKRPTTEHSTEPISQVGGTSVKTYLRAEYTDGVGHREGNKGAVKGGVNQKRKNRRNNIGGVGDAPP